MRAFKIIVNALLILVGLPVVIVGILGLVLSPFQTVAQATEPRDTMQVSDLMLSEAVEERVQQTLDERAAAAGHVVRNKAKGETELLEEAGRVKMEDEVGSSEESEWFGAASLDGAVESVENVDTSNAIEATEDIGAVGVSETEDAVSSAGFPGSSEWQVEGSQTGNVTGNSWYEESTANEMLTQGGYYSSEQLRNEGIISDGGVSYTWYSERVLPGGGLNIEGRHVSDEGYVVDGQGRIVVASSDLPYGAELSVPFGDGTAVVLDTGCAPGIVDVYTSF